MGFQVTGVSPRLEDAGIHPKAAPNTRALQSRLHRILGSGCSTKCFLETAESLCVWVLGSA